MEDPIQKPINPNNQPVPVAPSISREREVVQTPHIQSSEQLPNIPPEVREAGVEAVTTAEPPNLTQDHLDAGIQRSPGDLKPVIEQAGQFKNLDLTPIQALTDAKGKDTDANTWRATLKIKLDKFSQLLGFGGPKKVSV